jgi:mitochondrial inner membrane protease subunit 1
MKRGKPLTKGDIVIARSPTNPGNTVCKRVLGLPGDRILIQPQYWYQQEQIIEIPEGNVWLEGDNPFNSTDSRSYGPVPLALVKGLVAFKLFPLEEFGPLPRTYRKPGVTYPRLNFEGVER